MTQDIEKLEAVYKFPGTNEEILILARITMNYSFEEGKISLKQKQDFTLLANGKVITQSHPIEYSGRWIECEDENDNYFLPDFVDLYPDHMSGGGSPLTKVYSTLEQQKLIVQDALRYKFKKSLDDLNDPKELIQKWKGQLRYVSTILPLDLQEFLVHELNADNQDFQKYRHSFIDNDQKFLETLWNEKIKTKLGKIKKDQEKIK